MNTAIKDLKCIIVDDEPKNQEVLDKMLQQFCPTVEVLGKASSVKEAKTLIDQFEPNVVFLDVEMPDGNGFTLFDEIPNPNFLVIFTTAHASYSIKAIKFAALDYLLKPINLAELRRAVNVASEKIGTYARLYESNKMQIEVLQSNKENSQFDFKKIALPTQEGLEFFAVSDILRCEADRAYCIFHLIEGKRIVVSSSLKEYEGILSDANFFRIHKSNMVNLSHIQKYVKGSGAHVVLTDNSTVSVAVRKKEALLQALSS